MQSGFWTVRRHVRTNLRVSRFCHTFQVDVTAISMYICNSEIVNEDYRTRGDEECTLAVKNA